jgi:two-component system chemotaxis response regulator CheY
MDPQFAIARGPTPRVLVADADAETRARYRQTLHAAGCDVLEAADGRDALAKALSRPPSLVVTEALLPFIDGYALCALLRHDLGTRAVPILMVTAETRPIELARAREAGADVVLVKPAATGLLLNEMRRLLTQTNELRGRSRAIREQVAAQLKKAADLIERSAAHQRSLARRHERYATRTPPFRPPQLACPVCQVPLHYEQSHIGGVSSHQTEQWDRFSCTALCGTFEYRHRTRKLRKST